MTSGRKTSTNLHYVPWSGDIETDINDARASQLLAAESPEGDAELTKQYMRMEAAGVQGLRYALEAKGGVIVYCDNAQEAYDAIYGGSSQPEKAQLKAIIVPFVPVAKNTIQLNNVFGGAAQDDNGVSRAPKMHAMFDRATKGPALGERTLDIPALAA